MALDRETIRCEGVLYIPSEHHWAECPKRNECKRFLHLGSMAYQTPRAHHYCPRKEYSKFMPIDNGQDQEQG